MNIWKNIDSEVAFKVSTTLIYGFALIFISTIIYNVIQVDVITFITTRPLIILIVLNVLLLLSIFFLLLSRVSLKSFLSFHLSISILIHKVCSIFYSGVFKTSKSVMVEFDGDKKQKDSMKGVISNFNMLGLSQIFSEGGNDLIESKPAEIIGILSYFATSLFEKNNLKDVLWDIVENCISQLQLEDSVIYMLNKEKNVLIQKAAFGNKNDGERKVLSPIQIPFGKGIVGRVAQSGEVEYIPDVTNDTEYIVDDIGRMSELSVPIFVDDEVVGVLDSEHSQKGFFTENHVFLFKLIAKLTEKKLKQICVKNESCITDDNVYFRELDFLMREAKIYRDPNLGLGSMAQKLNISGNYLSQLVNKLSGYNFTDYVNGFRVKDAKSKLKNPKFVNYTIIAIALESGFNSKSTFYSAFKKITGISPKEFRQTS